MGTTTRRFVGHTKDVLSVAFSADNRQIVSGSRDRTIKLWNTLGVCKYTIQEEGHSEWISCVRFSPTNTNPIIVSAGDDDGVGVGWRETDAGDPFGMSFLLDGVFADAESVPQFDGAIAGAGDDLSVVSGEGDAEDVLGVSDESSRRRSHRQVPQTQSRIPRAGQSELSIRGQHDVGHEVTVALESLVGDTVVSVILGQLPDDDRLVTRRRKNHVREHGSGRNLRNPPIVSLQSSAKS